MGSIVDLAVEVVENGYAYGGIGEFVRARIMLPRLSLSSMLVSLSL